MRLVVLLRLLLSCLTVCILYLSLVPAPPSNGLGWDKANHALAMLVVTLFAIFSFRPAQRAVLFGAAYGFGLGALIELLQGICTVSRYAEWADLFADAIGVVAATLIVTLWQRIKGTA